MKSHRGYSSAPFLSTYGNIATKERRKNMNHIRGILDRTPIDLKRIQKKTEAVLNHPLVTKFILESKEEVEPSQLRLHLPKLAQTIKDQENCQACTELKFCPNMVHGHYHQLHAYNGNIDALATKCDKLTYAEHEKKRAKLITSHAIPKDVRNATLEEIDMDEGRVEAIMAAIEFANEYVQNGDAKGLYFWGGLGVGKSHIAGCIANRLASFNIASIMVHTPTLILELKDSIGRKDEFSINQKINTLSEIPVLIMDDIGQETYTKWVRDDLFGAIFQRRMSENLPTIFTSNLSRDELERAMSEIKENREIVIDTFGASRVMERIHHFTTEIFVQGKNWRRER